MKKNIKQWLFCMAVIIILCVLFDYFKHGSTGYYGIEAARVLVIYVCAAVIGMNYNSFLK